MRRRELLRLPRRLVLAPRLQTRRVGVLPVRGLLLQVAHEQALRVVLERVPPVLQVRVVVQSVRRLRLFFC